MKLHISQTRKARAKPRTRLSKSEQMARVRSRDTQAELAVRRAVWSTGLRYRLRPNLPGTPDMAFPGSKVAVFVDGCFWHGCVTHYSAPVANALFWEEKLRRNRARDRKVDAALEELGWLALRVWEHEIRDVEEVVARVQNAVLTRRTG
jgi:DNA mismatch endonuclease (patch repair protein)